ncbi:MAG: hypothetical protein K0R24_379 [Gammaproteobacteria bacterium]|nr:hypothetical protein [Gammaproteobacteria bacterium]
MNEKSPHSSRRGSDNSVVSKLIFVLWVAWVVAMGLNIVDWHRKGYTALIQKLDQNYAEQMKGLFIRNETMSVYSDAVIVLIKQHTQLFFIVMVGKIKSLLSSVRLFDFKSDKQEEECMSMISQEVIQFLSVMVKTTQVLLAKVISVLASFWVYIFYSLVGVLDGLVKRYIRTSEGGRESTFVFHKVSNLVIQLPVGIVVLYLIVPDLFSPEIVVILMSFSLFAFFKIATSQLKKYL